jgi:hypothetical protein
MHYKLKQFYMHDTLSLASCKLGMQGTCFMLTLVFELAQIERINDKYESYRYSMAKAEQGRKVAMNTKRKNDFERAYGVSSVFRECVSSSVLSLCGINPSHNAGNQCSFVCACFYPLADHAYGCQCERPYACISFLIL